MTSTPSATASSIAAVRSLVAHPPGQQALYAPMRLLLQSLLVHCSPVWQVPCQLAGGGPYPVPEKLGCSGQTPVSTTPMMTFSPALPCPPSWLQMPPPAFRPRNVGVLSVSRWESVSRCTETTPFILRSFATWPLFSEAAKPF